MISKEHQAVSDFMYKNAKEVFKLVTEEPILLSDYFDDVPKEYKLWQAHIGISSKFECPYFSNGPKTGAILYISRINKKEY